MNHHLLIVSIVLLALLFIFGCSLHPSGQAVKYPAVCWELGVPPPTTCKPLKTTKLTGLRESEYPDSINILIPKKDANITIGRFMNLGYSVTNVRHITRQDMLNMWKEEEYINFIRKYQEIK